MRQIIARIFGAGVALLAFWLAAMATLALTASLWPLPGGTPFKLLPQHLPAIVLGLAYGIYAYRRCVRRLAGKKIPC